MTGEYKPFTPTEGEHHFVHVAITKAGEYPENTEGEIRYIPARLTGEKIRPETYEVKVGKEFRDDPVFDLKLNDVAGETGNYLVLHLHKEDIYVEN